MKKKVVHLVYSMGCGGLEKVIVNLINGSHEDIDHIIISLTPEFEMTTGIIPDIQIFCLDKRPGKDIGCHFRLYKLLKQLSPDAINTYNFGTIEYHVTAYLAGVKTRVHSDHGHGGDAQDGLNKKNNFIRKVSSYFIDDYVVVSQDLMDWVTKVVGVKPKRLHLIQNGVEVPKELLIKGNRAHETFTICTVGRLDPIKNQKLLIDAFNVVSEKLEQSVKLRIVGEGPERKHLELHTSKLGLCDKVEFTGYCADVREQLLNSDVFVLSSHYEAMPMTILEAMALSLPVITTDVGGIRHFVDESYIWLTKPDDPQNLAKEIEFVLTNSANITEKRRRAYELVRDHYSISAMSKKYLKIYKNEKERQL